MTDQTPSASPVVRLLDRLEVFYRVCGLLAAGFLIALTGLVLASILSRLAGVFLGGVTELAGYAMAAGSFFALAWTFKTGGHIRVALVINRFGGGGRILAERWGRAVMAAASCYLAFYMGRLAWFSWLFGERSEGSAAFLLWVPQALVTIGAAALALATLDSFLRVLIEPERALATPEADTKGSGGEP